MIIQIGFVLLIFYAIYIFIKSIRALAAMRDITNESNIRREKSSNKSVAKAYVGLIGSTIFGVFFIVILVLINF